MFLKKGEKKVKKKKGKKGCEEKGQIQRRQKEK